MAHLCASLDQRGRANLASALRNANFSEGVSPDEEAFLEADENRDGHLSRAEFRKFWRAKQVAEVEDAPGAAPTHRQLVLVSIWLRHRLPVPTVHRQPMPVSIWHRQPVPVLI